MSEAQREADDRWSMTLKQGLVQEQRAALETPLLLSAELKQFKAKSIKSSAYAASRVVFT